jgi:hypothetical protein
MSTGRGGGSGQGARRASFRRARTLMDLKVFLVGLVSDSIGIQSSADGFPQAALGNNKAQVSLVLVPYKRTRA